MKSLRPFWLIVSVLVWVCVGCSGVEPRVVGANLGTTVQAGKIVNATTTFAPTDRMIHLVVNVENAIVNTSVGAKWYAVGTPNRLLFESDIALDAFNTSADFTLTSLNDWIPGNYQVVIYLNSKQDRTLDFVVR